jgi:hypothetical protein
MINENKPLIKMAGACAKGPKGRSGKRQPGGRREIVAAGDGAGRKKAAPSRAARSASKIIF